MNFDMEGEDPDFSLTPGARSRLSSLFQDQETADENPNQALRYTAPKQPKKQDQQASAPGQLKLIHAVAVHTYILESGKYSSQGQVGAAILGNHETCEYKLLLYKGKQQKITCCSINANFSYRVQENNYANFYDDRKINWSIVFDSDKSSTEFAKQIALAKANSCGGNLNSTIIQDLTSGEGTAVLENGGSADLKYVGWIFSNHTLGEVFDSNMDSEKPLRLRMGKSKVIKGWSGLLGSKKGTKRLVIIPPAFAYGSEGVPDKVPPNAVVVFEFHITKVKETKDSPSLSQSPAKAEGDVVDRKPEISPKPHSQSITDESIRMRGASISEQLMQSPKKGNATIISRMARMGMATLPFQGSVAPHASSESEAEDECVPKSESPTPPVPAVRSRESSPKPVPKPRSSSGSAAAVMQSVHPMPSHGITQTQIGHITTTSQPLPVYATASIPSHQHLISDTFPLHMYPQATSHAAFPVMQPAYAAHPLPAISPTVVPSMTDSHLTLLLTETRSQNTEVRLSLSKISDKVETVLHKVEDIRSRESSHSHSSLPYMESSVLLQNIQRIVQENTRLKEDVEIKNSKIQSLSEKICDLLQKNQRFFEESNNYLEQRTESSLTQSRILTLEQEKAKLMSEVHDALSKVTSLEKDLEHYKLVESELSEKLKTSDGEFKKQQELVVSLKSLSGKNENLTLSLKKNLQDLSHQNKDLHEKVQYLTQKLMDMEAIKESLEKAVSKKEAEIKEIRESSENQIRNLKDADEMKGTAGSSETFERIVKEKEELQIELEKLQTKHKTMYDSFCKQKEKFDYQVTVMKSKMMKLASSQASKPEASQNLPKSEADFDIKKTMNALYRLLQAKIEVSESYGGEEVLKICLETIRGLTARVLTQQQQQKLHSAPQNENSDVVVNHSSPAEAQEPELKSLSPPKTSNSVNSRSVEDQRSESSSLSASPAKSNTSVDSSAQVSNEEGNNLVLEGADSVSNEETVCSTENSQSHDTSKEAVVEGHSDLVSSEVSAKTDDSHTDECSQVTESFEYQEEKKEEVEQKPESQVSSETVLENGSNKKMLDVQQESVDDRKTPDQQSGPLFVAEHVMEAGDASKATDLQNGPLKVWKPQPPPLPLFDDDEDDDDWLK